MHFESLILSLLLPNQLFTLHFESNSPSNCHYLSEIENSTVKYLVKNGGIVHFEMHHNFGFYLLSLLSPPFYNRGSTACVSVCVHACVYVRVRECYRASRPRKADRQCATHLGNFPKTVGLLPMHSLTLNQLQSATYLIKCLQL